VAILRAEAPPAPRVLYADGEAIVVDKDPHEPTTPQGEHPTSLLARVRALPGAAEAVPVHRLDAGTSGACVFARRAGFAEAWSRALADPGARKEYTAGVRGIAREKGVVSRPLPEGGRAREARSRYRRLRILGGHSLLRVVPEQGRTHQIRRHLAAIGRPLLGDARHGHAPTNRHLFERHGLDRPFLHCARLELTHPRTGAPVAVEAPLAGDLAAVLASLERANGSPRWSRPTRVDYPSRVLDLVEEFRALLDALGRARVEFAVCGGLAVAIHARPRATVDVDLLLPDEHLAGAKRVARNLGYSIEAGPLAFSEGRVVIHRLSKPDPETGDLLSLDLLVVTPALRSVWETRERVEWRHGSVPVVSREGLIAMKRLRGTGQDRDDIRSLQGEPDDDEG
jgi:23S rRNA-/tRNA-specific pseudouridylate synthase